jgi:hypothetical protein
VLAAGSAGRFPALPQVRPELLVHVRSVEVTSPCDHAPRKSLDLQKTVMQDRGYVRTTGLTLAECLEIVVDLGIEPQDVWCLDGTMRVGRPWESLR